MRYRLLIAGILLCAGAWAQCATLGNAFTYQGRLNDSGDPAAGAYDFEFRLFDLAEAGLQIGGTQRLDEVEVVSGNFTAKLDFGDAPFNGQSRWLQIAVRGGQLEDPNAFTVLTPRQEITAAPYALYAANSGDSDTLAALSCENSQVPKWNGSAWVCGEDLIGGSGPGPEAASTSGNWKAVRLIGDNQMFREIVQQVAEGRSIDGSLVYLNMDGSEARRINFFGILPVSFETIEVDASHPGNLLAETLEFSVSQVELGINPNADPRMHLFSDNFLFELGGQSDNVVAVSPGAIYFDYPEPRPIDSIPKTLGASPGTYLSSYGFSFEIIRGISDPDLKWSNIIGGAMQFLDPHFVKPGIVFSNVELFGPMTNSNPRSAFVDWINGWMTGKGTRVNSSLEILGVDGSEQATVIFDEVVPVSYQPPAVDARSEDILREAFVFKANSIMSQ